MANSHIRRVDTATGQRLISTPLDIVLQDHGRWTGVRLEQWEGPSQGIPESVLEQHMVALSIAGPTRTEVTWSGHGRVSMLFEPGTLGIFPAGLPYIANSSGHWKGLILAIAPELIKSLTNTSKSTPVELIPHFGIGDAFIWSATSALAQDIRDDYPFGAVYGESVSVALAAHLLRRYSSSPSLSLIELKSGDVRKRRIEQYVLEQLREPLTLALLATYVQMDVFSFLRWFKSEFGMPPHQYLLRARVDRAKGLLKGSDMAIAEIAVVCGFNSQSHLATAFRRLAGLPPNAYRAAARR
jgi:AraC family transcriptional regulator